MASSTKQTTDKDRNEAPPVSGPTAPRGEDAGYDPKASDPEQRKRSSPQTSDNKKGGYGAG